MKIVRRIREIHAQCTERFGVLAQEVNDLLKPQAETKGWFFISRLKALESFALKIETGRVTDPAQMEDFFACTLVVPTMPHIEEAEALVLENFDQVERRPASDTSTHKQASSFSFDDLRLYVARRPLNSGKHPEINGAVFEIQIKTILQHAWSVATHDLIYKADTVSWPRERIAFQVKAMLEHAEIAIAEANRLADAPAVAKSDKRTVSILKLIELIREIWSPDRLPADIKRLAEIVHELLRVCDLDSDTFKTLVNAEKRRVGMLPADLSPYAFTVQAIANSKDVDLRAKLGRGHIKTKLIVHDGMDVPEWMHDPNPRIVNLDQRPR